MEYKEEDYFLMQKAVCQGNSGYWQEVWMRVKERSLGTAIRSVKS